MQQGRSSSYERPALKVLGSVTDLTRGSSGGSGDGFLPGKKPKKNKGS